MSNLPFPPKAWAAHKHRLPYCYDLEQHDATRAVYQNNNQNDTLITNPAYETECMSIQMRGVAIMNVAKKWFCVT